MTPARSHECSGCGGTGDRFTDRDIPAGMECGATCSGPSGPPTYGGLICGAPATWRDTTKRTGDGGFYDSGDLEAFLCEEHLLAVETPGYVDFPEGRGTDPEPCPVCLGSGRISDVRTARDAMVDAETLRQNGLTVDIDRGLPYAQVILGFNVSPSDATTAARAAFRAVPGLRGE